jgi:hypothetical protein
MSGQIHVLMVNPVLLGHAFIGGITIALWVSVIEAVRFKNDNEGEGDTCKVEEGARALFLVDIL